MPKLKNQGKAIKTIEVCTTSPYFNCNLSSSKEQDEGKQKKTKVQRKYDPQKFGGLTEEAVLKLKLPDHLEPNLDILIVGINPGMMSAYKGHHYAGPTNHFWPLLYESGLIAEKLSFQEDYKCPLYGIGLTNIVARTTRGASDLGRLEIKQGESELIRKVQELKPKIACFNGKGIYEIFSRKKCKVGLQEEKFPGTDTVIYVMPSTSGRTISYPRRADKLVFFQELKEIRDKLLQE